MGLWSGLGLGLGLGLEWRPARVAQQRDVGEQAQQQPPLRRRDVLGKQRVHDAHLGGLGLGLELGLGLGFRSSASSGSMTRTSEPESTVRSPASEAAHELLVLPAAPTRSGRAWFGFGFG